MAAETYFTGKPCKRGHISERYKASKGCVECTKDHRAEQHKREKKARAAAPKPTRNPKQKPLKVKTEGRRSRRDYSDLIKPQVVRESPESIEDFLRRGGQIQQVPRGATGIRE